MGISNDVITNRLDKKINYGFARTDFDSNKSIAAESLTSPIPNPSHNLWMDSDLIPTVPPLTNTSEVAVYKYNSNASQGSSVGDVEGVFEFTVDGTVQNKRSWLMHSTPGDTTTDILTDWIRVTYGAQYFPQFVVGPSGASGNTNLTPSNGYTPIFPVGVAGKEYYFDFEAGSINLIQSEPNTGVTLFFNLLIGLYQPSQGYISFENKHLPDIQIAYLRSQITLTPQIPFIPMGPLGELLDSEFTKDDQNLTELLEVLSLRNLVSSLRMGLNTPIPQGATCFGTRQRQVLSLARCLKTHSPILILDKCMSSFDLEQKIKVLNYLRKYNITTLVCDESLQKVDFAFDQVIDF